MPVVYQVIAILIAISAIANGSILIYRFFKMPKYGEGQTLQKINKLLSDNAVMKEALKKIAEAEVIIGFHPQENTEIYEYMEAITEMSRDIKRLMSKAHMALEAISASDEHPEEVE